MPNAKSDGLDRPTGGAAAGLIREWYEENRQKGTGDNHCLIGLRVRESLVEAVGTFVASALEEAARCADAQPYYPDTHTGMRQQWVKDQIAAKLRTLARERTGGGNG